MKEFRKKKAKITMMLPRMHHQSFLYIMAFTCCLRVMRSFMVRLRLLRVQM